MAQAGNGLETGAAHLATEAIAGSGSYGRSSPESAAVHVTCDEGWSLGGVVDDSSGRTRWESEACRETLRREPRPPAGRDRRPIAESLVFFV